METFRELQIWREAKAGVATSLPHDDMGLCDPLDYDAAARALIEMAKAGLMEIVSRQVERRAQQDCITDLVFRRLR